MEFLQALEETRKGLHSFLQGLDIKSNGSGACLLYNALAISAAMQFILRFYNYDLETLGSEALLHTLDLLPFMDASSTFLISSMDILLFELSDRARRIFKVEFTVYATFEELKNLTKNRFFLAESVYPLYEMIISAQESTANIFEKVPSKLKSKNLKLAQRKVLYYLWYISNCPNEEYDKFASDVSFWVKQRDNNVNN